MASGMAWRQACGCIKCCCYGTAAYSKEMMNLGCTAVIYLHVWLVELSITCIIVVSLIYTLWIMVDYTEQERGLSHSVFVSIWLLGNAVNFLISASGLLRLLMYVSTLSKCRLQWRVHCNINGLDCATEWWHKLLYIIFLFSFI